MRASELLLPKGLRAGDRVGIIAPSYPLSAVFPKRFENGLKNLTKHTGLIPVLAPHTGTSTDFLSAAPAVRAQEFMEFVEDPAISGILTTIGGANSAEMLPFLDVDKLKRNPKLLIGYSDTSALLLGIQALAGWVTFYGPAIMTQFGEHPDPLGYTLDSFRNAIFADCDFDDAVVPPASWTNEMLDWAGEEWAARPRQLQDDPGWEIWRPGSGTGTSFGGNVDTLNFLLGTPFIDVPDRVVLFWEACDSEASLPKLRRALTHLRQAGLFEKCSAMLVGRSPDARPTGHFDLTKIVLEACSGFAFPILGNCAFGHTDPMITLPIGVESSIDAGDAGVSVKISRGVSGRGERHDRGPT